MEYLADEVLAFVSDATGVLASEISLQTTLLGDLGVDGDDSVELMAEFARRFNVDIENYRHEMHFGPEGMSPFYLVSWIGFMFRKGTPERRAGLEPISICDLVRSASERDWIYEPKSVGYQSKVDIRDMTRVEITGWREGADKVGADNLLAHDVGLGLSVGKAVVDNVLAGQITDFEVAHDRLANTIISKLQDMGFDARLKQ